MFKFDVKEEIKSREIAKKFFPNYFSVLTGHSSIYYDYDKFQSEYIKYLEAYFNDEFDNEKRDFIKIGYNYLNSYYLRNKTISNRAKTISIFNRLWSQYQELEKQIATYRFSANVNSKGGIQNKINEQIIDQLSLFNPLIYNICFTVNEKSVNKSLSEKYNEQLYKKLCTLDDELNYMRNKLSYAKDAYYDEWKHLKPEKYYEGNASRNLRKARNEACYVMLKFVCEMVDIDIATYYGTFDYRNEQYGLDEYTIQKINYFNECLEYLQHSDNYYCYLDRDDKQEIAIQKVLKNKKLI